MVKCTRCRKPVTPDRGDGFNRCEACWAVERAVGDNFHAAWTILSDIKLARKILKEKQENGFTFLEDGTVVVPSANNNP
jgi:hypothetical protein